MKLKIICRNLVEKLLGEPGTLVERMGGGAFNMKRGGIYKVTGIRGHAMTVQGSGAFTYYSGAFRKAKKGT